MLKKELMHIEQESRIPFADGNLINRVHLDGLMLKLHDNLARLKERFNKKELTSCTMKIQKILLVQDILIIFFEAVMKTHQPFKYRNSSEPEVF